MYTNLYKARIKKQKRVYYISAKDEEAAFYKLRDSVTTIRFEPLEISNLKYLELITKSLII